MRRIGLLYLFSAALFGRSEFWAPATPPHTTYDIAARLAPQTGRLDGSETIRFRNTTNRDFGRIALAYGGNVAAVRANGSVAARVPGTDSPLLYELPDAIQPGQQLELVVEFNLTVPPLEDGRGGATSGWHPRLWWGGGAHADYVVRLQIPDGYTVATSGRFENGAYRASNVRAFALFVGQGYESAEADAGDVRIRTVFKPKGAACAKLLLSTAVDVVNFYRQRFGFYPHKSLLIVPGMDYPAGGYPIATAVVSIHGQERMSERPENWWRWITAHEIGHMYWSEHVLAPGEDTLGWLMIGLGIYTDREYRRARGIRDAGELWTTYRRGVEKGYDTTMDLTPSQAKSIKWDLNNVVIHGKSAAALNALESVAGPKMFDTVIRRCLRDYAGKRLNWREFQRVAEEESGQNLDWFFDQWVRSPAYASYKLASQNCTAAGDSFDCAFTIRRDGTMRMPLTVLARFADGTEQRAFTERLVAEDTLRFRSKSPLKSFDIEPDSAVVMAEPPPPQPKNLQALVQDLPWTGAGDEALTYYRKLRDLGALDESVLPKLALLLYDGRHYTEALDAFHDLGLSNGASNRFMGLVWQGHILDLLGRRPEAITKYEAALKVTGNPRMQHSQYNLTVDRNWVEQRLKTPFAR